MKWMQVRFIVVCVISVLLSAVGSAEKPSGQPIVYKTVDGVDLSIYVSRPQGWNSKDSRPAIVFFHGGGWTGGAPGQFTKHAEHYAGRGLVCFQVQYRLLDRKSTDPPEVCLRDARSAMRFVRSRAAEFGVDPDRIASSGGSAGGHLAAGLGTLKGCDEPGEDTSVSVVPNAMILFNPVFDNGPDCWGHQRVGDRYPEFSPAHNISQTTPPAIVFLGDSDKLIPVSTLTEFQKKMQAAGVRCETQIFPGMPHGFFNHGKYDNRPYEETIRATDRFLESLGWLKSEASGE